MLLVFEDSTYGNAPRVGNVAAAFAGTGRAVVIGAFYDQDRSDAPASVSPHGWGALEQLDPNTTDGTGTPYAPRTLDTATMVAHPLTAGITSLSSAKFAGGNNAKPGTTVVAWWNQPNALGGPGSRHRVPHHGQRVRHPVRHRPQLRRPRPRGHRLRRRLPSRVEERVRLRREASARRRSRLDPGGDPANVPTLSQWGLALTILLLGALAARTLSAAAVAAIRSLACNSR